MNTTQRKYIAAKAAYDSNYSRKEQHLAPFAELLDSEDTIEQYVDLEIEADGMFGVSESRDQLKVAEKRMFAWVGEVMAKCPEYAPVRAQVEPLVEILSGTRKPSAAEVGVLVGKKYDALVDMALRIKA